MSERTGEKLKRDIERTKDEDHEKMQAQFARGEITAEEYEQGVESLLESGDDFLDYEETKTDKAVDASRCLKEKLKYYSLPICVLAPVLIAILTPGISPMLALIAGLPLMALGFVTWAYLRFAGRV